MIRQNMPPMGKESIGTPLDADHIDPRAMVEITVELDDGEEVLTPKNNERFGSYDFNEAARYVFFLSTTSRRKESVR